MDNTFLGLILAFAALTAAAILVTRALVKSRLTAAYDTERVRLEKDIEQLKAVEAGIPERIAAAVAQAEKAKDAVIEAQDTAAKALLEARDKAHGEALQQMKEHFAAALQQLKTQVKADTDTLLRERQQEFKTSGAEALGHILEPFKSKLEDLRKEMSDNSDIHKTARESIRSDVDNLMKYTSRVSTSAEHLAAAFKYGNKLQGTWGETILEELLSSQGLTKGIHFDVQPTLAGADASLRPDVIIHLDRRREVIVDAKASLSAYVNYVNASTEEDRQRFLKAHIDSIKNHVKELAKKDYAACIKAPKVSAGYVIMFVPNMGALWTALNAEPDLWRRAAEQNVYIADEQSLYGAIRIVQLTWTQVQQAENHEKVYELADEMMNRVEKFLGSYEAIGKALAAVEKAYEEGHKKLEPGGQSITRTAMKLAGLGAKKGKIIEKAMMDLDEIPRLEEAGSE